MTRNELLAKLKDIEWDDFEVKEAATELPKNIWETVSAFSNASGGWIVLGIKQKSTHNSVESSSDLVCSTVAYFRGGSASKQENVLESHLENQQENHPENHPENHLENPHVNPYENPHVNPHEKMAALDVKIFDLIKSNARITYDELASLTGKHKDTIRVHLKSLRQKGLLVRIGPDKGGHWEVVKD